jgi:hypothetical protein
MSQPATVELLLMRSCVTDSVGTTEDGTFPVIVFDVEPSFDPPELYDVNVQVIDPLVAFGNCDCHDVGNVVVTDVPTLV